MKTLEALEGKVVTIVAASSTAPEGPAVAVGILVLTPDGFTLTEGYGFLKAHDRHYTISELDHIRIGRAGARLVVVL